MTGAELRVVRGGLGLSGPQLAAILDVDDRTVRRWELGETPIPDGVRRDVAQLQAATDAEVDEVVTRMIDGGDGLHMTVYRSDDDFWAAEPQMRPWPASWQRMVAYRVLQTIQEITLLYDSDFLSEPADD